MNDEIGYQILFESLRLVFFDWVATLTMLLLLVELSVCN